MPNGPEKTLLRTLTIINDNWVYLSWIDKLEIVGRVAVIRYRRMSRRRKALVLAIGSLVAGVFLLLVALSAGAASREFREVMYAFALGLLIGSVVVYFALYR